MKSAEHVCRSEEKAGEAIVTDAAAWGKVAEPCRLRRLNVREGMGSIHYVTGDATRPEGLGAKIICHVCNDIGGWGRGFVTAVSAQWAMPENRYRAWHAGDAMEDGPFELGAVQFVPVAEDVTVANMIGQQGIRRGKNGAPPVRYGEIRVALKRVAGFAAGHQASVHMPRIGAGLAGGDWSVIEGIIAEELCGRGIKVTVYDLPG